MRLRSVALLLVLMVLPSAYAAKSGPLDCPMLFTDEKSYYNEPMLLSEQELGAITEQMHGYQIKIGVKHYWKNLGSTPFDHARANPMGHWLANKMIVSRLQKMYGRHSLEKQMEMGLPIAFFHPRFEDVVNGDPHFGNIGLIPLNGPQLFGPRRQKVGNELYNLTLHVVYNDFDDGGMGPLFGDALRNFATSYLAGAPILGGAAGWLWGLDRHKINVPAWVQPYTQMSIKDFEKLQVKQTQKLYRDGQFQKKKNGIIEKVSEEIATSLGFTFQDSIVDPETQLPIVVSYMKEKGGSAYLRRYWLLRQLLDNTCIVSEYKWITDRPGVMGYKPRQPPPGRRWDNAISHMWHSRNHEVFRVDLGDVPYFVRPRYSNPIKKQVEAMAGNPEQIAEWARFSAELLGEDHDMSPRNGAVHLLEFINAHPQGFYHSTVQMVRMINTIFKYAQERGYNPPDSEVPGPK